MISLFGLSATLASAQTAPETTATPVATAAPATDSAQAVKRLFASRRKGAVLLAIPGGYVFGAGLASLQDQGATSVFLGGALAAVAIGKESRFSKKKEDTILTAYQQGQPLPQAIRRRLKKKHFN